MLAQDAIAELDQLLELDGQILKAKPLADLAWEYVANSAASRTSEPGQKR